MKVYAFQTCFHLIRINELLFSYSNMKIIICCKGNVRDENC